MKAAFGQALVATFREILFVFLQTLENAAIARLHCQADSLHIFDASKPISFSFPPAYQSLPDDLLTGRIQTFEPLYHATAPVFFGKRIRTERLHLCLTLHFRDLPGTAVTWNGQSAKSGHR